MTPESNFSFLPQGALIQAFRVAGQNIVLGFPTAEPYRNAPFFGETVGRVANRIHNASFRLNNHTYHLAANDGANHAHGGNTGWGKKYFRGPEPELRAGREAVRFTYISPHEEEGYPGTVEVRVWYSAYSERVAGDSRTILEAEYEVELIGEECEETVVNLTNHSYFNLSAKPTIEDTECTLQTTKYLQVDESLIPTGNVEDFPGLQKGQKFVLGAEEPSIDSCFIIESEPAAIRLDTRDKEPRLLVSLFHPESSIHLEVLSTEPAFQLYTGHYVDVPARDTQPGYGSRAGVCIEPGRYINAVNVPKWQHMVVLGRGQLWGARTIYRAWKS